MPTKHTHPLTKPLSLPDCASRMMASLFSLALLALPAQAQDKPVNSPPDNMETTESDTDDFLDADRDGDQSLDLAEFRTWVLRKAEDCDEDAKDLVLSGAYKSAFVERDQDRDGLLSRSEVEGSLDPVLGDEWKAEGTEPM